MQDANCKVQNSNGKMQNVSSEVQNMNIKTKNKKEKDLGERFLDFAADNIKLTVKLKKTAPGRYMANQLMRAASASGANYEEACGAESQADFIHKMQLVLKELRESLYWLRLIKRAELIPGNDLHLLLGEADQLAKIVAQSVLTAKGGRT